MKKFVSSLVLLSALISGLSFAGVIYEGKITKIAIDKGTGDKVFIQVDGTKEDYPACHTVTSWSFVLPLSSDTDNKIFSMLLAARASKAKVRLEGNGLCNVHGSVESLTYFTY